jgi:hypothetical protein
MLVPTCGSRCAREGASSEAEPASREREPSGEAEPARGRSREREPSSEAEPTRGSVSPRARQTLHEGVPCWAAGAIAAWAVLCAYVLRCVRGVFVFCVFCRF